MYEELYKAWIKEKTNLNLQSFPDNFYSKLINYVKSLKEENRMLDKKTLKATLIEREFRNVKKLLMELVKLRYEKTITNLLQGNAISGNILTEEEKELYKSILPFAEYPKNFVTNILRGRPTSKERKANPQKKLLRFLEDVPALIGSDMKRYGPFKGEDLATIPFDNAKIFLEKGIAVEVES